CGASPRATLGHYRALPRIARKMSARCPREHKARRLMRTMFDFEPCFLLKQDQPLKHVLQPSLIDPSHPHDVNEAHRRHRQQVQDAGGKRCTPIAVIMAERSVQRQLRAPVSHRGHSRLQNYLNVEKDAPMLDVVQVEAHHRLNVCVSTAGDLPQTRYSRPNKSPCLLPRRQSVEILGTHRSWTDK